MQIYNYYFFWKIFFELILGFKDLILDRFDSIWEQKLINIASKKCI